MYPFFLSFSSLLPLSPASVTLPQPPSPPPPPSRDAIGTYTKKGKLPRIHRRHQESAGMKATARYILMAVPLLYISMHGGLTKGECGAGPPSKDDELAVRKQREGERREWRTGNRMERHGREEGRRKESRGRGERGGVAATGQDA